jgi:hypothetical protein
MALGNTILCKDSMFILRFLYEIQCGNLIYVYISSIKFEDGTSLN